MKSTTILFAAGLLAATALTGATAASAAPAIEKSATVTAATASQAISFDVFLPLRNASELKSLLQRQQDTKSADYHKWLTPAQFKAQFGPTDDSVARVSAAMKQQGFSVDTVRGQSITFSGDVGAFSRAFGAKLNNVQSTTGATRIVATSPLALPAALKAERAVVMSFAPIPLNRPMHRNLGQVKDVDNRYSESGPYWFTDLKQAYSYPRYNGKTIGQGVNVAIVMEYDIKDSDVAAYFNHEKFTQISGKPVPTVIHHPVNGGGPFNQNGSAEASLDVQQVLGGAPGASVTLFSLPNLSNNNIAQAYSDIVDDGRYSIVSSSFGGCELYYSASYNGGTDYYEELDAFEDLFMQGNAEGITFVASSGDNGGLECPSKNYFYPNGKTVTFHKGVSWPAVSPSVTAVGGGNLVTSLPKSSTDLQSKYKNENGQGDPLVPYDPLGIGQNVAGGVWGAGGGISDHFAKPDYQYVVTSGSDTKRTVPDVGMEVGGCPGGISQEPCGTPRSSVITVIGGQLYTLIGTSVAAPEFAGALALYVQKNGRQGNLNSFLYQQGAAQNAGGQTAFYRRPTHGKDGAYAITQPSLLYNYIYGNGSPIVNALFGLDSRPASDPQTVGNP